MSVVLKTRTKQLLYFFSSLFILFSIFCVQLISFVLVDSYKSENTFSNVDCLFLFFSL